MKVTIRPHPTHAGWYQLEYRPEGRKGKKHYLSAGSYEQAVADARSIEERYDKSIRPAELRPRIADIVDEYLVWVRGNQADKTWRDKVQAFKVIGQHFGKYRPGELTQRTFDEFGALLTGKRAAIIKYQHYLQALIGWMVKRKLSDPLPFKPEKPEYHRPIKQVLHPSDIDAVLSRVPADKRVMLELMLYTGLRWNEARMLRWEDLDTRTWSIRVRESVQEGQALVSIPLHIRERLVANQKAAGTVFLNPHTRRPWGSFKTMLQRIERDTGVKLTPNDLRRASATYLYEATGDIYAVQHHLRHKDVRTSQIYTRYSASRSAASTEALANKLDALRSTVPKSRTDKTTAIQQ